MSLSAFKELATIEHTLNTKAKQLLHEIFKSGKRPCITKSNLNALVTFMLPGVQGIKNWPLFQKACISIMLAYCEHKDNLLEGVMCI